MLREFLIDNEKEVLKLTESKTLELSGVRPTSVKLKEGLPIFFKQLLSVLAAEAAGTAEVNKIDGPALVKAANESDEPAIAKASLHPQDAKMAMEAGFQGKELFRLGYTLSHVVHAYGSMCQAITQIATEKKTTITPAEFNDLNRCLDVAIAGAVTEYQSVHNTHEKGLQIKHLGFLAHELRNSLSIVTTSLQLIQRGTVGFGGSTAEVLNNSLKNMAELIDRSLAEVRLSVDPVVHLESVNLLRLVDQCDGRDLCEGKKTNPGDQHPS
jgi:signal transduction histidine kinase